MVVCSLVDVVMIPLLPTRYLYSCQGFDLVPNILLTMQSIVLGRHAILCEPGFHSEAHTSVFPYSKSSFAAKSDDVRASQLWYRFGKKTVFGLITLWSSESELHARVSLALLYTFLSRTNGNKRIANYILVLRGG